MAPAVAVEDLFAIQADLDRPIEQQRRLRNDDLVIERIALAAEAAAVGRGDDADVRGRHRQRFRERAVQIVRRLRARIDDELAVGIHQRDRRMLLERQMRVSLEEEHIVEDMVGAGESGVDVAELERHRLVDIPVLAVVVNARLGMREAVRRRGVGTQRLVLDVDEARGVFGGQFVPRDDGGHGIPNEPHLVAAECVLVVTDGQDAVRDRKRVAGQDQADAFDLRGGSGIDANDACMRMRRPQQTAMQHPRQHDVIGETRLTGDLGAAINPATRATDDASRTRHRVGSASVADIRRAAASTASMICQ